MLEEKVAAMLQLLFAHLYSELKMLDNCSSLGRRKTPAAWMHGCIQGLLEIMRIPYTGSGVRASAVAMDKIATKLAVASLPGVRLAPDCVLRSRQDWVGQVPLPVVVKPSVGGSTIGIQKVEYPDRMPAVLGEAFRLCDRVLVEQVIVGDEITVAVLEGEALPVVRIVPQSGFFDFEAKYEKGKTRYEVPAPIPSRHAQAAQAAEERALVYGQVVVHPKRVLRIRPLCLLPTAH